jgi:hypothetical protein
MARRLGHFVPRAAPCLTHHEPRKSAMPSRSTTDPRDQGPKPRFQPKTQPHPGKTEAESSAR